MSKMEEFKELVEFAGAISAVLGIVRPNIEHDENDSSAMSCYIPEEDKVRLQEDLGSKEAYFTLVHELRHKWQLENQFEQYFLNYKEIEEIDDDAYSMQKAEIDANAFAMIMMYQFYEDIPLFEDREEYKRKAIFERAQVLTDEYKIDFPWSAFFEFMGCKL